ncbi:MAG: PAS domain-containing protein, partial [Gemmatimonadales bacterium]
MPETPLKPRRHLARPWIVLVAGSTLALVAGAAWEYRLESQRVRDDLYQSLATVGALRAGQIQRWRWEREGDATVAAQNPLVIAAAASLLRSGMPPGVERPLRDVLRATASAYSYSNALLLAPDARLLFALREPAGSLGPTTLAAVRAAAADSGTLLSNFFRGADTVVRVDVAAGVRDAGGRVFAVLVLRSSLETHLSTLLRYWPAPSRTASSAILRRDGDNVVVLNNERVSPAEPVATAVPIARTDLAPVRAALGDSGRFDGPDQRGVHVLANLRSIPATEWFLVTAMDESEVLDAVAGRTRIVLVIAALSVLLVVTLGGYEYRRRLTVMLREMYAAEHKEREGQAVFRTTLYSIGDAVITTDEERHVTALNRVAEDLTGWSDDEARSRPLAEVYRIVDEATRTPPQT